MTKHKVGMTFRIRCRGCRKIIKGKPTVTLGYVVALHAASYGNGHRGNIVKEVR